jgi:hypothetical protein
MASFAVEQTEFSSDAISADDDLQRLKIRPYRNDGGVDTGIEFIERLHKTRGKLTNKTTPRAFEIVYGESGDAIDLYWLPLDADDLSWLEKRLKNKYPDSDVSMRSPGFLGIDSTDYVAGGHFGLVRHRWYPIRRRDTEDFREDDPYEAILSDIVDSGDSTHISGKPGRGRGRVRSIVQILIRPCKKGWTTAKWRNTSDWRMLFGRVHGLDGLADDFSGRGGSMNNAVAEALRKRAREPSFEVIVRFLSVCDDSDAVYDHVQHFSDSFAEYYNGFSEQGFSLVTAADPAQHAANMATRTWLSDQSIPLSSVEVGGLAHNPLADMGVSEIAFSTTKDAGTVPPGADQFDVSKVGATPNISGGDSNDQVNDSQ